MAGRYKATGPESEFESGSRGRVLRNRLGITSVRVLERKESEGLLATTQLLIDEVTVDHRFTANDVRRLHHLWLGEIYEWAGEYRSVNIAKGEFMFAAATQVPRLMQKFEQGPLHLYTPCRIKSTEEQAAALAVVHAEFILIHPFRDGNGRCARLLAMLMGLQAGLPALDFGGIRGAKKCRYIAAVHSALDHNYAPMAEIFRDVIARTLKSATRTS
ncbi:MAG: Fic/DOC family protein [Sulfuricaulis sp.]